MVINRPFKSFAAATIIHPDLGVQKSKVSEELGKKSTIRFRPQMPQECIRLKRMWEVALEAYGVGNDRIAVAQLACSCCVYCKSLSDHQDIRQCAICLHIWHPECCQKVLDKCSKEMLQHDGMEDFENAVPAFAVLERSALKIRWQ